MMRLAEQNGVAEVGTRLGSLNDRLHAELKLAVGVMAITLQGRVKTEKLRGQVLGVRTGRGWNSIKAHVEDSNGAVSGVVSTNANYMIGWETGWEGWNARKNPLAAAKAASRFSLSSATPETFKNGTPRKRAFLVPALTEYANTGAIARGINAAIARANAA